MYEYVDKNAGVYKPSDYMHWDIFKTDNINNTIYTMKSQDKSVRLSMAS